MFDNIRPLSVIPEKSHDDRWFQMSPDVGAVSVCLRDVGVTLGWLTAGPSPPLSSEAGKVQFVVSWRGLVCSGPEPARAVWARQPGLSASSELRAPGLETGAPSLWWLVSDQSAGIVTRGRHQTSSRASYLSSQLSRCHAPVMSHNHNWSSENTSRGGVMACYCHRPVLIFLQVKWPAISGVTNASETSDIWQGPVARKFGSYPEPRLT